MSLNGSFILKIEKIKDLFMDEFYEKKPLYIRGEGKEHFSIKSYVDLISEKRFDIDELRLVMNGDRLDRDFYTRNGLSVPFLVYEYFRNGYTIAVHNIEKYIPELIDVCDFLNDFLYPNKTQINSYFSPKSSSGLTPHFDVHDVFIYQINGEKRWQVWDSFLELPNDKRYLKNIKKKTLDFIKHKDPILDLVLKEGDILYIPRGFIHKPFTEMDHSLHFTIGVLPRDIFSIVSQSLKNVDFLMEENIKDNMIFFCEKYIKESIKERNRYE